MTNIEVKYRESVLKTRYLLDAFDISEPLPTHLKWQSPLVAIPNDCTQVENRMKLAGAMWLENFDLIPKLTLILADLEHGKTFLFFRATKPNICDTQVGPVDWIPRTDGIALFGDRVKFWELDSDID